MLFVVILFLGGLVGILIFIFFVFLSLGCFVCFFIVKDMEVDVVKKGEWGNLIGIVFIVLGMVIFVIVIFLVIYDGFFFLNVLLIVLCGSFLLFVLIFICVWFVKMMVDVGDKEEKVFSIDFDVMVYKFILVRGFFVYLVLVVFYFMIEKNGDVKELFFIYIGVEVIVVFLLLIIWGKIVDKSVKLIF